MESSNSKCGFYHAYLHSHGPAVPNMAGGFFSRKCKLKNLFKTSFPTLGCKEYFNFWRILSIHFTPYNFVFYLGWNFKIWHLTLPDLMLQCY